MTTQLVEPTETDTVLQSMLTENTGRHMLDSGSAYGRNWERNQGRDFSVEPDATADWRWGYLDISISVFHALREVLDYHADGDALFYRWATTGDRESEPWFPLAQAFAEDIGGVGLFGDGPPMAVNTYNEESMLAQVIQYVLFSLDEDTPVSDYLDLGIDDEPLVLPAGTYVLLQVHGGCDVRGGYTRPRLFELTTYEDAEIFDLGRRASVFCNECYAGWATMDVCYFEPHGDAREVHNFEDYDWIDLTDPKERSRWKANRIVAEAMEALDWDEDHYPLGVGYYHYRGKDTPNKALCPNCGVGELGVGAY